MCNFVDYRDFFNSPLRNRPPGLMDCKPSPASAVSGTRGVDRTQSLVNRDGKATWISGTLISPGSARVPAYRHNQG